MDTSYISDLVASRGTSDRIYIKLDSDVDFNSMRRFADSGKHTEGTFLYILSSPSSSDVSDFAARHELVLWDRHELEKQIGRAILANAAGEPMKLTLVPPAAEIPSSPLDVKPEPQGDIFGFGGMFTQSEPEPPAPKEEPAFKWPGLDTPASDPRPDEAFPPQAIGDNNIVSIPLPSMPINLGRTSALKIGQAKVGEVQGTSLKFIPYYGYRYDFDISRKFRNKVIDQNGRGEGMVNAITGDNMFTHFPPPLEYVEIPTDNYQIKEPLVNDKDALDSVMDIIIKKHTETMKMDEVKGDAVVYERKTISPAQTDINMDIHLIYVPIWEIEGKKNTVEINAYDGHVMDEPVDDDAEFV